MKKIRETMIDLGEVSPLPAREKIRPLTNPWFTCTGF
jgi:hypothetical protein